MTAEELRQRMYGPKLRAVLDPIVFPDYEDEYASEGFMTVTPGQTYQFTVGGGTTMSWKAPSGVTSVKVECFGGGGAVSVGMKIGGSGRGGVYSLGGIVGKIGP